MIPRLRKSQPMSRRSSKQRTRRRRRTFALIIAALLGLLTVIVAEAQVAAAQEFGSFQASRSRLDQQLAAARIEGYTDQQLAPVEISEAKLTGGVEPVWVGDRPGYYQRRAQQLDALRAELAAVKRRALAQLRLDASNLVKRALAEVDSAGAAGVTPADLIDLRSALAQVEDAQSAAGDVRQLFKVESQASSIVSAAQQLVTVEAADQTAIRQAAGILQAQLNSSQAALRKAGGRAVASGRNDASAAAFIRLDGLTRLYDELERYHDELAAAGSDPAKLAFAAAGAQHYAQAIHQALIAGLPPKIVLISYDAQRLWAYDKGRLVRDTLVTTGRPELPTDIGEMKVLKKDSPWTMHSPWPHSSPWWYPDTKVKMAIWFTYTGESMHDASWEYDWQYGPGGQFGGAASHGCVHVPLDSEKFLYGWTAVGTPVVVFPGDGSTVVNQVAQITVDADGSPTTGPKGV